jgi:DNA polymerase-3 subunit beta
MEVECLRENLIKGLNIVGRIIPSRPSLPVLASIRLSAKENKLTFFGTDLEIGAQSSMPVKIINEGVVLAPAKLLLDYISSNQDPIITLKKEGNVLLAQSEHYKATFSTFDEKDYPTPPEMTAGSEVVLPFDRLIEAFKLVIIACSNDESRPILNGLYVLASDDLRIVGTDSYRLAEYKITQEKGKPFAKINPLIIPKRTISEVIRIASLMPPEENSLKILISEKEIRFVIGENQLYSRLIEGNFPDYEKVIPKNFSTTVVISRSELLSLVKAVSVFNKELNSSTKVMVLKKAIKLKSSSSEFGQLESVSLAKVEGEELEITFNTRFLLEVLTALSAQEIVFSLNTKNEPARITTPESPHYQYIMMPLRVE